MPINEDLIPETTPEQKRTVGRAGEKLTIDKNTFEVKGVDTGTIFGSGENLQEALAIQTAIQSGSSPTVAGRPDLLATAQRPGVPVETIEGADGQQVMPTVATPSELTQRSMGTLPSFNAVTGTQGNITAPEAPEAPKPLTDYATALKETIASSVESKKQELLGAPDDYDSQILRQKGALMTKLLGQDLTPDELKWLTPSQSSAIISGDTKLIEAELAGLNTIVQGRKEMKKEAEEKALRQYDIFAQSGIAPEDLPEGFLSSLDAQIGLPDGTFAAVYTSQYATLEAEKEAAALSAAQNMYSFLSTLPVGEIITIDGIDYQSLNKGEVDVFSESDGAGNMNIISYNRDTGEYDVKTLYGVTEVDGWEFSQNNGVGIWTNSKTQEMKVAFDLNSAEFTNNLEEAFPTGAYGGQCGEWVRDVTGYEGASMTTIESKEQLVADYGFLEGAGTPRSGMTFVMNDVGDYGHVGIVESATLLSDGSYELLVRDSNWGNDETVKSRTINSKTVYGYADLGLKSEYKSGTDSSIKSFFTEIADGEEADGEEIDASADEWKAAGFGSRMSTSNQILNDNLDYLSGLNAVELGYQRYVPNWLKSYEMQLIEQAERNFINAVLRRESGAAIAESEFDNAQKQYFAAPGDSLATLEQKKANREAVIANFRNEAGVAWSAIESDTDEGISSTAAAEIDDWLTSLGY